MSAVMTSMPGALFRNVSLNTYVISYHSIGSLHLGKNGPGDIGHYDVFPDTPFATVASSEKCLHHTVFTRCSLRPPPGPIYHTPDRSIDPLNPWMCASTPIGLDSDSR